MWLGEVLCLSAAWYFGVLVIEAWPKSEPVTADLKPTVVNSYKLYRNDGKSAVRLSIFINSK